MIEHKSECIIMIGSVALLFFQPSSYCMTSLMSFTKGCCTAQKWLRQQTWEWLAAESPEGIFHEACFVIVRSYYNRLVSAKLADYKMKLSHVECCCSCWDTRYCVCVRIATIAYIFWIKWPLPILFESMGPN